MIAPPIPCFWDGEFFRPAREFARKADEHFVIGKYYRLVEFDGGVRSGKSHGHYFACIKAVHDNLDFETLLLCPNPEALRKWALIKAGYCTTSAAPCRSRAEAARWAKILQEGDEFVLVEISENFVVTVYRAQSQSESAMGRISFQQSKDAVLRVLSDLIGTDAVTLKKYAEAA